MYNYYYGMDKAKYRNSDLPERCEISMDKQWSIVRFTGPDSKGRKPHQARWKEQSMTGMRAVADPSLVAGQLYVGLKDSSRWSWTTTATATGGAPTSTLLSYHLTTILVSWYPREDRLRRRDPN